MPSSIHADSLCRSCLRQGHDNLQRRLTTAPNRAHKEKVIAHSAGSDEEPAIRYLEADQEDEFVAWLEGDTEPYYEPLGRSMVATAEMEAAVRELLIQRLGGANAWAVVNMLSISQALNALRALARHDDQEDEAAWLQQTVRDVNELLEPRNLLAHGLWMPLYRRGMAVVSHKRGRPELQGKLLSVEDVVQLAEQASALASRIREHLSAPRSVVEG